MAKLDVDEVIRIHVYEDGDVILQKHVATTSLRILYPCDILFDVTEVTKGALNKELLSYGCDPVRVKEAIDEVIKANYYDTINV